MNNKSLSIYLIVEKDLNLIKEVLNDIMNTTCIKFVPDSNEPGYVVFGQYKHPSQERG